MTIRQAALGVALICATFASAAQESVDRTAPPPIAGFLNQQSGGTTTGSTASPIFPSVWCGEVDDEGTREQCWQTYRASLRYYETGLDHRSDVFAWQHFSTQVIFFVVLGLVGVGVAFAWLQFRHGMRDAAERAKKALAGRAAAAADPTQPPAEQHQIEISTTGIKVSSPVLGVVILSLSLAFFYLYLIYVYPIKEIF